MVRAGLVVVREESFEKNGEQIAFQRASLTFQGRRRGAAGLGSVPLAEAREKRSQAKKKSADENKKWFFVNKRRREGKARAAKSKLPRRRGHGS